MKKMKLTIAPTILGGKITVSSILIAYIDHKLQLITKNTNISLENLS